MSCFKIKPFYTVRELADLAGVSKRTMRTVLTSAGVVPLLAGSRWLIPLTEIEEKLFSMRESFERAEIYKEIVQDAAKK